MSHTIRIPKPQSPLPPLPSPARKWVPKSEWATRAIEREQAKEAEKPSWSPFNWLMGRQ